jgi:Ran-binding protein 1
MAETDTKLDPAAEPATDSGPKLVKDDTEKLTTGVTEGSTDKEVEEKPAQGIAGVATGAASAVKDSVFSMFGGGPKKEKKAEEEAVDEPSGSSKAQAEKKAGDVG